MSVVQAMLEAERTQISMGWKDVTMRIFGTDERIVLPVMISSRVGDVKNLLAEMHGGVAPHELEFVFKQGISYKRHRNGDEIQTNILVKGIKSFVRGCFEWPLPLLIIGAGHMGLRQALHFQRHKKNYTLVDKFHRVGGNAWANIANPTSKLQTEGPQYQLQYDVFDGSIKGLVEVSQYGYWPSREEILAHFRVVLDDYGVTPHIRLNTEVCEMTIHESPDADIKKKYYDFAWRSTTENYDGVFKTSVLTFYPGCLVVPHRKTWPGEDVFGGHIGYGFSQEFDYVKVDRQDVLIIGMGAFAHENVRTVLEHGGRKCYNIARHFNLMMPRMVCWWVNQSVCPPTAAMVLHAMEPFYQLIGMSPWNFFSVTANAERTVATIKQYTRWGISDVYILAMYFGKLETVNAEVKRFKERAAVLSSGRVIEDLDHVIKVIGFDGDFGVDQLMQTTVNLGPWPDGDHRRWTLSDNSAIDASRFTNIAISPAVSSMSYMVGFYVEHPECGFQAVATGMLPENKSEPEVGSPAYHYEPRTQTAGMMLVGSIHPDLMKFDTANNNLKKASHHHLAHPRAYQAACERDWYKYCKLFKDQGMTDVKWPVYPCSAKDAERLVELEEELGQQELVKYLVRQGLSAADAQAHMMAAQMARKAASAGPEDSANSPAVSAPAAPVEAPPPEAAAPPAVPSGAQEQPEQQVARLQEQQEWRQEQNDMDFSMPIFYPGDRESFEPARRVLAARIRSQSPARSDDERQSWLREGHEVKDFMVRAIRRSVSPQSRAITRR